MSAANNKKKDDTTTITSTTTTTTSSAAGAAHSPLQDTTLPTEFLDCHHHFLDTGHNPFQSFLRTLVAEERYLPADYHRDVVEPLQQAGVKLVGSVHVECMPDEGLAEAWWVQGLMTSSSHCGTSGEHSLVAPHHHHDNPCTVQAIVASCDLSQPTANQELEHLAAIPHVKGIRWILDADGPFDGTNGTHAAVTRHDAQDRPSDYLRVTTPASNNQVWPAWEQGFALLETYNLSFDLQCAPAQLPAAAALLARHPNIPVVVDHLGKPRTVLPQEEAANGNGSLDTKEIHRWKQGMQAMAALPHVYCKISMLGYAVPGWFGNAHKTAVLTDLVRYVVQLFGPERCMVGLNWWKDAAMSDADGLSDVGPSPVEFLQVCVDQFFVGYSHEDLRNLFAETARRFYRIVAS